MEMTNHINLQGNYITEYANAMDLTDDMLY